MEREKVDDMLKHFQEHKGRFDSIKAEIALLEFQIETLKRNAVNDLVLHGRNFDGMPHGSGISKPTESAGLRLADGYTPNEALSLQERVNQLRAESQRIELDVLFVEAWMNGLTESLQIRSQPQ